MTVGPHRLPEFRSGTSAIDWPPVSRGRAAELVALVYQVLDTQWMPPDALRARQHRQLVKLATHFRDQSPHFRDRLARAGLSPDDLETAEGLRRLPVLHRRELQRAPNLNAISTPKDHHPIVTTSTSGSTGEPVVVRRTGVNNLDWLALTVRQYLWNGYDLQRRVCSVRRQFTSVSRSDNWGLPASALFDTGQSLGIPIRTDIDTQIQLIRDFEPAVLCVYPSIMRAIARRCVATGRELPSLTHIYTLGETLSSDARAEIGEVFGARVMDCYSSEEVGYIAMQCPDTDLYHIMSETVIVEVLGADGEPCRQGQAGRVTITDIRNFATPVIRYDIGDFAEPGPACKCGRGLPTLSRIHGRERNLILMPDGSKNWPLVGFVQCREIAPVVQYQLIQHGRDAIEVRLVVARPLEVAEEAGLRSHIQACLGYPFDLRFVYFDDEIPLGPNGKFEDFTCRVNASA